MVTEAFARAFARAGKLGEEDFRLALFGAARELMDLIRGPSTREGLTVRERDLVALLFDGLLDHREVARLLSISEEGVTAELVRALKKLRTGKETPNVPSVLRA
jgi:DNA-binding CsgD family transcriptional regulator